MKPRTWKELLGLVRTGNVRGMARLITRVENRDPGWKEAMAGLYQESGSARVVGITGSPGAGKSTLTNALARELADRGKTLGIIAVDPSSPFSGGALLGDRLRMDDIVTDPRVFIRSMATRGALGGLCQGARDVARILDAFGKDIVIIETVGVGQDEVEVVKAADTVMVVCVPGQGDGIQALKAGIMEIADIYVVNKADREGAAEVVADIEGMLHLGSDGVNPPAPVLLTSAMKKQGIAKLADAVLAHEKSPTDAKAWPRQKVKEEMLCLLGEEILGLVLEKWGKNGHLDAAVDQVLERKADPYSKISAMMADMPIGLGDT